MTLTMQKTFCVVEENSGIIEHQRTNYYIKNLYFSLNVAQLIEIKI